MDKPLVSVVVISYNSSDTIEETLDSIKAQTYENVELIVSDDNSTDQTCSVVSKWLDNNKNYFVRAIFVSSDINSGPTGNANRGISKGNGTWIKLIAADDALLPNCITDNVHYVSERPDAGVVFSLVSIFGGGQSPVKEEFYMRFWHLSKKQQYMLLLMNNCLFASSAFIKKDTWERLDKFDERIPFIEDWPFWIKAMRNDVLLEFMNKRTVMYRVHSSLSISPKPSERYLSSLAQVKDYARKCQWEVSPIFRLYCYVDSCCTNRLVRALLLLFNPYYWYMRRAFNSLR